MPLDATIGGSEANSYADVAFADAYFSQRLNAGKWASATGLQKEAALITGTRILDQSFDWAGSIVTTDQKLRWPRNGVLDRDRRFYSHLKLPLVLKESTCEEALYLLQQDRQILPGILGKGVSSASIGSLNITVDLKAYDRDQLIPSGILMALSFIGEAGIGGSGNRMVPLQRV